MQKYLKGHAKEIERVKGEMQAKINQKQEELDRVLGEMKERRETEEKGKYGEIQELKKQLLEKEEEVNWKTMELQAE